MPLLDSLTQVLKSLFWAVIPKTQGEFSIPFLETIIDIILLAILIYYVLKVIRASKALQLFQGLAIFLIVLVLLNFVTAKLQLISLNFIVRKTLEILPTTLPIFLAILFQPELRKALGSLGGKSIFEKPIDLVESSEISHFVKEVTTAMSHLSKSKIGAIIAIERQVGLGDYESRGLKIDSEISSGLVESIFNISSPLHDGGIIIRGDRIAFARCVFPLSKDPSLDGELGTRHRAAVGLSEETDAIIICVSEESGIISLANAGSLTRYLSGVELEGLLKYMLDKKKPTLFGVKRKKSDG
ncbi:MAG: diadenylate cyclase CdaA [Caldisericia bacterium]|nr:diadenylate cyclase CdaA [Caldisericia bacterium]